MINKLIVIVGPTASGKTLCYNLPVLNRVLQDPDARAPFTVDDVVGEILSDTDARNAVMDAFSRSEGASFLGMILQNQRDLTLRQALGMLPNSGDLLTAMIDALAKLREQTEIAK